MEIFYISFEGVEKFHLKKLYIAVEGAQTISSFHARGLENNFLALRGGFKIFVMSI